VERLRLLPESTRAHYYEGVLHLLTGRPRQASESARLATTADPENAAAWNLLGASLGADNSSPDEIRLCFERAIDADPADPAPYVNLGTLELKLARLDAAADWFAQALTLDPASLAARDGLVAVQRAREQQRHPKI
jgi:Flp pilus assembly protein TadD